jgi:hypothetical protein
MSILVVTPYTGSEKLVRMTEGMLSCFAEHAIDLDTHEWIMVAANNAASRPISRGLADHNIHHDINLGFGSAVEHAIRTEMTDDVTHVLVLNNDLVFNDKNWLRELMAEKDDRFVVSPVTDVTATKEAVSKSARDGSSFRSAQVSAFCWLVPRSAIAKLKKHFGFHLFHPDFSNYGSDDVTGACLRRVVDPKPFKVVPRSWVKHLKAQTANELGVKAGTKELLAAINVYKKRNRLS